MLILYLKIQCGIGQIWCYQIYLVIPATRWLPDAHSVCSAVFCTHYVINCLEKRDAAGWQAIAQSLILLATTVFFFASTFTFCHFAITINFPLILAVLAPVITLTVARFWLLKKIKRDNEGRIRNGWKETWELFPDYHSIIFCVWPLMMAVVRLSINTGGLSSSLNSSQRWLNKYFGVNVLYWDKQLIVNDFL